MQHPHRLPLDGDPLVRMLNPHRATACRCLIASARRLVEEIRPMEREGAMRRATCRVFVIRNYYSAYFVSEQYGCDVSTAYHKMEKVYPDVA